MNFTSVSARLLAPALRVTRPDIASVIRRDGSSINLGGKRLTLQNVLVVSQVAMSTILLIAAALFTRALAEASDIDPGFTTKNVLLAEAASPPGSDGSVPVEPVMEQLRERVLALPGVRAASWAGAVPLSFESSRRGFLQQALGLMNNAGLFQHFRRYRDGGYRRLELMRHIIYKVSLYL
mgnify:CR=1 FL=1